MSRTSSGGVGQGLHRRHPGLDEQFTAHAAKITALRDETHPLRDVVGIRAVLAARLLARTGPASSFASAAARAAARRRSVVRFQGGEASCWPENTP